MRQRPGFLIGLIVLVAGSGYVIWQSRQGRGEEAAGQIDSRLLGVHAENIVSLEIERAGSSVRVERSADGWIVTGPDASRSPDVRTVTAVVSILSRVERLQTVRMNVEDLKPYGLGGAGVSFRVTTDDGRDVGVEAGLSPPTEEGIYARVLGSTDVVLADTNLEDLYGIDPGALFERALLTGARAAVRLEIARPLGQIALEREGDVWRLVEPFEFPADRRRIAAALAALEETRLSPAPRMVAEQVAPEALAFEAPWLVVTCTMEDGTRPGFIAGAPASVEARWVRREGDPGLFTAESKALEVFSADSDYWHSRRPSSVERHRARSVRIDSGGRTVSLTREGGGWVDGQGRSVPESEVLTLVAALFEARARSLDPEPETRRDGPSVVATVIEEGGREHTLEAWGPNGSGQWWIRPRPYAAALVVSESTMEQFLTRFEGVTAIP